MVSQFHHLFIPIISLLFFLFPVAELDLAADRAALVNLYDAIGGHACLWNVSNPYPCSWKGVTCNKNATAVIQLRLPGCRLSGQIPNNSIGSLTNLQNLSLRLNSLSGPLPPDLGSCTQLQRLFLQDNNFSGQIPATLFALTNLVRLNLAGNSLSGEISPGFNNLTMLRILELENNNLIGSIPELNNLTRLRKFNVSYNRLDGSIPSGLSKFSDDSFLGNTLCGSPLDACPSNNDGNGGGGGKKLSTGAIIGIVVGSVIGLILILLVLFFLLRKRNPPTATPQAETSLPRPPGKPAVLDIELDSPKPLIVGEASGDGGSRNGDTVVVNGVQSGRGDGLVFFGEGSVAFALEDLLRAPAEVLGKGTFGSTYKAYLEGETQVAVVVKRLRDVCVNEREFREKVEDLGMLAHENLLPFRAYYCGREEKLIVFDCMPMGSLSALLHEEYRAALTWEIRTKLALGAAHGIEYLHSLGSNVSHGNIKSSNILLTDFYAASVSEYGICQLVSPSYTLDQNGYRAPEVTDYRKISQKADVYSFGVLLLELLTGKAPNHGFLNEKGVDLPRWVRSMNKENQTIDVFDQELLRHQNNTVEQMVQLLRVGIHCTSRQPEKRPSMVEVTREIRKVVI
ncbi:probable inactive receptor kinase At1g48480 isoform X2 [Rhododendron vialii]|uniref:probable inactive receptor kinase At1g48480 isoform X2 n=1 Tax=Rhododendron vialii TaxID=182163 RepID=UPI00265E0772|nr:probable inactive receptor kinase At1g48480 isoform X2 [Rhododendron vialii]